MCIDSRSSARPWESLIFHKLSDEVKHTDIWDDIKQSVGLTGADWYGEDEQGCQGDAGRAQWTHGAAAAAAAAAAAGDSALLSITLALDGPHPSLSLSLSMVFPSFSGVYVVLFWFLTPCSSESCSLTSEEYEGSCQNTRPALTLACVIRGAWEVGWCDG